MSRRFASMYDPPDSAARAVVDIALAEDAGIAGDITSSATIPLEALASGRIGVRRPGVMAGGLTADLVFQLAAPDVDVTWHKVDGDELAPGDVLADLDGSARQILVAERPALNVLGMCSGIATLTAAYARLVAPARVRDTRKTAPGLRALQKAAVRAGGGANHRDSLSDAVLIKDNHLAVSSVGDAVANAHRMWPGRTVELECDHFDQVKAGVGAGADMILVDNMTPDEVRDVVVWVAGRVPIEASGGIDLDTAHLYADTGVDFVAVGALTHSAPVLDIGLDLDVRQAFLSNRT